MRVPAGGVLSGPQGDGLAPGGSFVHSSVVRRAGRATDHRHTEDTDEQTGAGMCGACFVEPQPGLSLVRAIDREATVLPSEWSEPTSSGETGTAFDQGAGDRAVRGLAVPSAPDRQAAPTSLGTHMALNAVAIDGEPCLDQRSREATAAGLLRRLGAEPAVTWAPAWPRAARGYLPRPAETPTANGERP